MRFSIVYDDNGVVLAVSVSGGDAGNPVPGPGMSNRHFDVPDDMAEAEQRQVVERLLIDTDPEIFCRETARTNEWRDRNVETD